MKPQIILASSSPHRKKLLKNLGFEFDSVSPEVDERALENQWNGPIEDLAAHLSNAKALTVFKKSPNACVIGSDQLLIFKGQSFADQDTPSNQLWIGRI